MRVQKWPQLGVVLALLVAGVLAAGAYAAQPTPNTAARALAAPAAQPFAADDARLFVGHFAPFASDDATVTVSANGQDLLTNFNYGQTTNEYIPLPAGSYDIAVTPAGATDPTITDTVVLSASMDYTAAAIGDGTNQPLDLLFTKDDNTLPTSAEAKVRVIHVAPFTDTITGTLVDVRTDNGDLVGNLENIPYGTISDYLTLPSGTYNLKVTTPGNAQTLLDLDPFTLNAGDIVTVFAIGDGVNKDISAALFTANQRPSARVKIAHFAPFNAIGSPVEIRVDGAVVLTNISYTEVISDYLELTPGEHMVEVLPVEVFPADSNTAAISKTLSLDAGQDYTVVAIGDGDKQPLDLLVLEDDNASPVSAEAKVRVVHVAPFAAGIVDTRVDVLTQNGTVFGGLSAVPYGASSDYITLPSGEYDLKVNAAGSNTTLIDPAPFTLNAGDVVTIFAIGGANGQAPTLYAVPGGDLTFTLHLPMLFK